MDEILPKLYLGDLTDGRTFSVTTPGGVRVCTLECEPFWEGEPGGTHHIAVFDPTTGRAVVSRLVKASIVIDAARSTDTPVLVHCGAGVERSPLTVAWYLWTRGIDRSMEAAYERIRAARPMAEVRTQWLPFPPPYGEP